MSEIGKKRKTANATHVISPHNSAELPVNSVGNHVQKKPKLKNNEDSPCSSNNSRLGTRVSKPLPQPVAPLDQSHTNLIRWKKVNEETLRVIMQDKSLSYLLVDCRDSESYDARRLRYSLNLPLVPHNDTKTELFRNKNEVVQYIHEKYPKLFGFLHGPGYYTDIVLFDTDSIAKTVPKALETLLNGIAKWNDGSRTETLILEGGIQSFPSHSHQSFVKNCNSGAWSFPATFPVMQDAYSYTLPSSNGHQSEEKSNDGNEVNQNNPGDSRTLKQEIHSEKYNKSKKTLRKGKYNIFASDDEDNTDDDPNYHNSDEDDNNDKNDNVHDSDTDISDSDQVDDSDNDEVDNSGNSNENMEKPGKETEDEVNHVQSHPCVWFDTNVTANDPSAEARSVAYINTLNSLTQATWRMLVCKIQARSLKGIVRALENEENMELAKKYLATQPNNVKCSHCRSIFCGKIFECKNRHGICQKCCPTTTTCPKCVSCSTENKHVALNRNTMMEGVMNQMLKFPCVNITAGCSERLSVRLLYEHYRICRFRKENKGLILIETYIVDSDKQVEELNQQLANDNKNIIDAERDWSIAAPSLTPVWLKSIFDYQKKEKNHLNKAQAALAREIFSIGNVVTEKSEIFT